MFYKKIAGYQEKINHEVKMTALKRQNFVHYFIDQVRTIIELLLIKYRTKYALLSCLNTSLSKILIESVFDLIGDPVYSNVPIIQLTIIIQINLVDIKHKIWIKLEKKEKKEKKRLIVEFWKWLKYNFLRLLLK